MNPLFNLVGTNSLDGDHAMLQRWYADHVHLLFHFGGLLEAQLMQRADLQPGQKEASAATHYLCLYRFASAGAFAAFEVSPERANAPKLGRPEWMAGGIQIALRQQYEPVSHRSQGWSGTVAHMDVQAFHLPVQPHSDAMHEAERWLQGCIHEVMEEPGALYLHLLRRHGSNGDHTEYLAVRGSTAESGTAGQPLDLPLAGQSDRFGPAPVAAASLWSTGYRPVATWSR